MGEECIAVNQKYVACTYQRYPVTIVRGRGSTVWGSDGRKYIDLGSGIGVNIFGIADEMWQRAVCRQLVALQHASNLYYTEPCADLAKLLCEKTGMENVFFSNSGAEANECMIKAARKYAAIHKAVKPIIVTLENSFHGRTLGALAATAQEAFHKDFGEMAPGFAYVQRENIRALKELIARCQPAAVMIECIQGEGGIVPLSKAYVKEVEMICKANDMLLMVDEVQTGNGRTGKLFSYMHYDVCPDIISTAKGIGGGLPLGATIFGKRVSDVLKPGDHASTFGGNPVCCAGAINILRRLDETFLSKVAKKGENIKEFFKDMKGVEAISGMGLMIGIQTKKPANEVAKECLENGVLVLTAKNKVRIMPALNISNEQLFDALKVLKASIENN